MFAAAIETEGHRCLHFRFRLTSGAMATARGLGCLLTLGRWRRGLGVAPQSRAFVAVVPGVSQVDNKSDFLKKRCHRRHPGILQLSCVRLPQALADAAQLLLLESSMPITEKQVQALTSYLWSRHLPVEPEELQRRAVYLEKKYLENADSSKMEEKLHEAVLRALRKTTYHWQELSYNEGLSLLYMAARLDGGFAAVSRAFHEIQARLPEFQPKTLMDFGSGTGSVTWAAHSTWGQSLREYMCVDSSAAMLELAEKLLKGGSESGVPSVPGVFFRQFLPVSPKVQFDVVVSAFSLSELPSKADRADVVQTLWRKTGHFLILVENGTKAGHSLLMDARDLVLNGKEKSPLDPRPGFVFAPCPHELPCPQMTASKPLACSFSQAYHPIPFSWNKKPKEEKFSMVILARGSPEEATRWPRITQPVLKRPRHVHCHLCCPDGQRQHAVITARRHGRDLYRCARVSSWGDLLPVITPSEPPPSPAQDPPES
ncbi:methyltransferase-like protein 17, mitochondrial isoform X1 [Camelus ferus]|uniref:Ribosome assembly protein METTL17, mitochondrial n=3 Tax=Camelus TaxID=9836 RepID=A0A8B6YKV6_CAMFR|nr:methyltransferase-like protein 17, mitochondrial isoform X1 [Camelus ferus]XP_010947978.2 methyltransferase-like protein 17, mitochondrial isoform X1 [Camelus bactrianus]XP_010988509.2 methyltransferase-like protein 17, mitochondrial isoform X1 [Camelus dromedarius]